MVEEFTNMTIYCKDRELRTFEDIAGEMKKTWFNIISIISQKFQFI